MNDSDSTLLSVLELSESFVDFRAGVNEVGNQSGERRSDDTAMSNHECIERFRVVLSDGKLLGETKLGDERRKIRTGHFVATKMVHPSKVFVKGTGTRDCDLDPSKLSRESCPTPVVPSNGAITHQPPFFIKPKSEANQN